jgi:hypothetical protein
MEVKKPEIPKEFQVNIKDKTPDGYPKKFFATTMCGSSRAGKTTCIINIIQNLAKCYKSVIIFSPSADDPSWTSLRKFDNVYMSNIVSNHILHKIFERQKVLYKQDKTTNHSLVILDDFGILSKENGVEIGKEPKNELVSSGIRQMMDLLYSRARHNGISILASYHDSKQMSPLQRVNSTHWILYRLNDKQYEKIAPEIRCHLSEKEFCRIADEYTKQPYHFLYIDLKAPRNEDVFKHGKPEKLS